MLSSSLSAIRLRLGAVLLLATGPAALVLGAACSSSTGDVYENTCSSGSDQECFIGIVCVEACGGPIKAEGCCPCPEGLIDTQTCDDAGGGDGG